jgi:cellulose synthase (UDP-forming)
VARLTDRTQEEALRPIRLPDGGEELPGPRDDSSWTDGGSPRRTGDLYGRPLAYPTWRVACARFVSLFVVAVGANYLVWRLSTLSGTGRLGLAFYAAEVLNFLALVMAATLFWRVRWRSGLPGPPAGTIDVLIPVCGEPVELVERTLRAALAITYPHKTYLLNDGRFAGKPNWEAIDALARSHGVTCFTRTTGAPGKGGNLNYGLAHTNGEFVATIDADHVAVPELAHETLGYFLDREVAFVSTPQQFVGDAADVLNNRELLYFRYMAASKDADNAVQTYGNGVYRRSALGSIGGFSEWVRLCEDLHSCYRMQAAGWKGVYHPRAVTTGLAPQTAAALAKQRLTWATDSVQILFWDNPMLKKGLSFRQRLHYFQTVSHYLITCTQLLFAMGVSLWFLWGISVMHPRNLDTYLWHTVPYFAGIFVLLTLYGGIRGSLRVVQSTIYLAPVYLVGVVRGLFRIGGRPAVTEKVRPSRFSALLVVQLAFLVLTLIAIGVGLVRPIVARGLVALWGAWIVFCLSGFLASVSERAWISRALRLGIRTPAFLAVGAVLLLPPLTGSGSSRAIVPEAWTGRPLAMAVPVEGAYWGVFNPDLLKTPDAVTAWDRAHGVRAHIVDWYQQWFSGYSRFRGDWADMVRRQGAIPMITWEPWANANGRLPGAKGSQPLLSAIASGRYDAYIHSWARGARLYGRPILLRPMELMNGSAYPWAIGQGGNTGADFVRAWRHIHDLFAEEGAGNVRWVWSINAFTGAPGEDQDVRPYYPGADDVDWVSMSGFNWGQSTQWGTWRTFDEVFGTTYRTLEGFRKPVMVSEVSTVSLGGDPGAWVRDAFSAIRQHDPLLRAVVWFDAPLGPGVDFRLRGAAATAFRSVAATAYWSQRPRVTVAKP